MFQEDSIIESCIEVFKSIGLKRLAKMLQECRQHVDEEHLQMFYKEAEGWIKESESLKKRNFVFGNDYSIMKIFVVTQSKKYDREGNPVIAINELADDSASFKDNPIKNLYIIYQDEEQRDKDFERLLIARG